MTKVATLLVTVTNVRATRTRGAPSSGPTRLESTIAQRHGWRHALARHAVHELTRDPVGQLVAMAASAGDFGPAVALAALRGGAEPDAPQAPALARATRTGAAVEAT